MSTLSSLIEAPTTNSHAEVQELNKIFRLNTITYRRMMSGAAVSSALFAQSRIAMLTGYPDGGIAQANCAFMRLLGYDDVDATVLNWRSLTKPEDLADEFTCLDQLESRAISEYSIVKSLRKGDNTYMDVITTVRRLNGGIVPQTLYVMLFEPVTPVYPHPTRGNPTLTPSE